MKTLIKCRESMYETAVKHGAPEGVSTCVEAARKPPPKRTSPCPLCFESLNTDNTESLSDLCR